MGRLRALALSFDIAAAMPAASVQLQVSMAFTAEMPARKVNAAWYVGGSRNDCLYLDISLDRNWILAQLATGCKASAGFQQTAGDPLVLAKTSRPGALAPVLSN